MKRTLLMLVVAGLASLVGGAVKGDDPITILETRAIRLDPVVRVPTQGYQPFTRDDVIFVGARADLPPR